MINIKKAVADALGKEYPGIPVYAADKTQGYKRPCFFLYVTQTFSSASVHSIHKNVEVEIDYIQKEANDDDALAFFSSMQRMFALKLPADDGRRMLNTSDQYMDSEGENKNIPVFGFNVEYWEAIEREPDESVLMGEVIFRETIEKGE